MALTPEEEQELAELEEMERLEAELGANAENAATPPRAAAPPPDPDTSLGSKLGSAAMGVGSGGTFGFADELSGLAGAGLHLASKVPGLSGNIERLGLTPSTESVGEAYRQGRGDYRAMEDEARAANPLSFAAGEIAGGMAIPGGAGRGLTRQVGRAAAEGAAYGVGTSRAEPTEGEIWETVKDAIVGGGWGGVGGAAGQAISKVAGAVPGVVRGVGETLEDWGYGAALKALGTQKSQARRLLRLKDVGAGPERIAKEALDQGIITPGASAEQMAQRVAEYKRKPMEWRQRLYDALDKQGLVSVAKDDLEHGFLRATKWDPAKLRANPDYRDALRDAFSYFSDDLAGDRPVNLNTLQEAAQFFNDQANWNAPSPTVREKVFRDVSRYLRGEIEQRSEEAVGRMLGQPETARLLPPPEGATGIPFYDPRAGRKYGPKPGDVTQALRTANKRYQLGSVMDDLLENRQAAELGNRVVGLSEHLGAGAGFVAGGDPASAAAGLAAARALRAAPQHLAQPLVTGGKFLQQPGGVSGAIGATAPAFAAAGRPTASTAADYQRNASTSDWVQEQLQSNPQALGSFAAPLSSAMQRGEADFASTLFTLQEQSPEFRELLRAR